MRGATAKQIRRVARQLAAREKTTLSREPEPLRYLTGFRRTYRALKAAHRAWLRREWGNPRRAHQAAWRSPAWLRRAFGGARG